MELLRMERQRWEFMQERCFTAVGIYRGTAAVVNLSRAVYNSRQLLWAESRRQKKKILNNFL